MWRSILSIVCAVLLPVVCPAAAEEPIQLTREQKQALDVIQKINTSAGFVSREQFVAGSVWFTAHHELGHLLIDEYDLPLLGGREEDMADIYAVVTLSPHAPDAHMFAAVRLFLLLAFMKGDKPIDYTDSHSINHQRAFQLACHLAGRWPDRFSSLADAFGVSPDRLADCEQDSIRAERAWDRFLKPERGGILERFIDRYSAVVRYDTVGFPPELNRAEAWLRASGVLEALAAEVQLYAWPDWRRELQERLGQEPLELNADINDFLRGRQYAEITGAKCGFTNAYYVRLKRAKSGDRVYKPGDPMRPKLVFCYELVSKMQDIADQALPK